MAKANAKMLALLAAACAVVAVAAAAQEHLEQKNERYQQHLEAARPTGQAAAPWDGTVPTPETLHTHLPIITLDTHGQAIPGMEGKETMAPAVLEAFDENTGDNTVSGTPTLDTEIRIRYRGNSSLFFDKHQYLIDCVREDGTNRDVAMLGMEKHHKWVLNGPFLDKTLLRNYMWMNLSGEVMGDAPDVRFCEVFLNGEYQGVYVMMEKVTEGGGRVALTDTRDRPDGQTSYLLRLDRGDDESDVLLDDLLSLTHRMAGRYNVVYPTQSKLTPAQQDYLTRDLLTLEKALYSLDYDDPLYGADKYLDLQSFADYMVINELARNMDAGRYSTYCYRDVRGKLRMGPVWDFNNALDNYVSDPVDETDFSTLDKPLYDMLLRDERFTGRVIRRYRQLRQGVLSEEALLQYIDGVVEYLGPAVDRNFSVWGNTFGPEGDMLEPASRNLHSYEAAVEQVKSFLVRRGRWLDEHIESLWEFSHESKVKKYQH